MSEQLQYYEHSTIADHSRVSEALTRANEVHELAADIQHVGAVALFSEVEAGNIIGLSATLTVPNPAAAYVEKRSIGSFYGKGRERRSLITATLDTACESLIDLQTGINEYAKAGTVGGTAQAVAPHSKGLQILRETADNDNRNLIWSGADLPLLFQTVKDKTAEAQGINQEAFTWTDWLHTASDEQLTNFSQWYTEQLKVLANPETKARYVQTLKSDYTSRVAAAMAAGWIDSSHKAMLDKKIAGAELRFYSPFGDMPNYFVGMAQSHGKGKELIVLPIIAGEHVVIHELGHVFAGISYNSMDAYYANRLGRDTASAKQQRTTHLFKILNEGFNDHMTDALLDGDPTIIRPSERVLKDSKPKDISKVYQGYREVFGVLAGGVDGKISSADIRNITETMVADDAGSFDRFARLMSKKWQGRDVMMDIFEVVDKHDQAKWSIGDRPADSSDDALAKMIVERLTDPPI